MTEGGRTGFYGSGRIKRGWGRWAGRGRVWGGGYKAAGAGASQIFFVGVPFEPNVHHVYSFLDGGDFVMALFVVAEQTQKKR